jgi:hypothetical protein
MHVQRVKIAKQMTLKSSRRLIVRQVQSLAQCDPRTSPWYLPFRTVLAKALPDV